MHTSGGGGGGGPENFFCQRKNIATCDFQTPYPPSGSAHEMRRDENSVIFKCENQNDGWSYRGSALPTICSLYSGSLHDKTSEMTCARITDWDHSLHFIYLIYLLTLFSEGKHISTVDYSGHRPKVITVRHLHDEAVLF